MQYVILFNESNERFVYRRVSDDFVLKDDILIWENVRRTVHFDGRYPTRFPVYSCDDFKSISERVINEMVNLTNKIHKSKKATVRTCTQCYHKFVTLKKTDKWYLSKGMSIPKRCCVCRDKNRIDRSKF